jgi:hypothetical protein
MMQHCQQVFAELNQGGVSVGGGGVPRTMIAGMGPPQQMGMQPGGAPHQQYSQQPQQSGLAPQQQGFAPAAPQAKTMIAQVSPFAGGAMPQQQQPHQQQPQGGYQQANPAQKTIVAGVAPPGMGNYGGMQQPGMQPGYGGMQQPGMQPQGTPQNGAFGQQPTGGGPQPQKTMMLQPSDGVVSVARAGGAVQPAMGGAPQIIQGASPVFWIVSLFTGIAVGVLAYVIVLQM